MDSINVLVIDADEANRNFLAQVLQKKNDSLRQAATGDAALQTLDEVRPSIVIFDTHLPTTGAMETLHWRTTRIVPFPLNSQPIQQT